MTSVPQLLEDGFFHSADDVARIMPIDWQRSGYSTPLQAIRGIGNYLHGAAYAIYAINMDDAPPRDNFPTDWRHTGQSHGLLARLYWNWLHAAYPGSDLALGDAPDFCGMIAYPAGTLRAVGDFGRIAAFTFAVNVVPQLNPDMHWISVLRDRHVIVRPTIEIGRLAVEALEKRVIPAPD